MITIGYSTRTTNKELQEYFKKSAGHPKIQVIEKVNSGEKNLSQVYNEIISESIYDVVVLCHDDIYFDTKNWFKKIIKHFEKTDYGVLGMAGTTNMPSSGMWWEDRSKMYGIVNHESGGKKWESKYSDSLGNDIKEVVVVDGVFIAIDKNKIKQNFDESVDGFHMYDINFCFNNFLDGVKIGVITDVRITHKSVGMTNAQWDENRKIFAEKYSNFLPSDLGYKVSDKLSILTFDNNVSINYSFFNLYEKINSLSDNFEIIHSNLEQKNINFLSQKKIKNIHISETPGFILGDGKKIIQTTNGPEITKNNQFYKIGEPKIDLIIVSSNELLSIVNNLYPNVKKLYLNKSSNNIPNDVIENLSYVGSLCEENKIGSPNVEIISNINIDKEFIINLLNSKKENYSPSQKIKIITGFSEKGGSTTAFINLTNLLNKSGINCTLYGPHTWHLDKCKSGTFQDLKIQEDDILIYHFIELPQRPNVKKVILSCHEKNLYMVGEKNKFWDVVVFLHEEHRSYHSKYVGDYTIIPNLKENLIPIEKNNLDKVAGVIGSIDENKQTHISIQRALDDGCEKVYVFGQVTDVYYYENYVKKLIDNNIVVFYGTHNNKQQMYDMIGRVYHSSISEVACLVKDECGLTNTKFFGNHSTNNPLITLTNEEIINKWINILN